MSRTRGLTAFIFESKVNNDIFNKIPPVIQRKIAANLIDIDELELQWDFT